jgi:thiamine-phosphate pyrophosphorylase
MNEMRDLRLGLYVITCAYPELERGHLDIARAALEGGADALQLRDKQVGGGGLLRLACKMRDLVGEYGKECLITVNDRVDVALAAEVDGVHLGQEDLPAKVARRLVGEGMVLGISASTVEEALLAQEGGADYLGVGPGFPTPSKADACAPIGIGGLRAIVDAVDLPVVAIGGISEENLRQVFEAGATGIAVISAVAAAPDMPEAVLRLRMAVDSCLPGR